MSCVVVERGLMLVHGARGASVLILTPAALPAPTTRCKGTARRATCVVPLHVPLPFTLRIFHNDMYRYQNYYSHYSRVATFIFINEII